MRCWRLWKRTTAAEAGVADAGNDDVLNGYKRMPRNGYELSSVTDS